MTSTVLDGVFCLLLISAAVVTVTTATPQEPAGAGRAPDVASTLTTSTASVNYTLTPRPDTTDVAFQTRTGAAFGRTSHGTLATLLARAAVGRAAVDGERLSHTHDGFAQAVARAVGGVVRSNHTRITAVWRPYPDSSIAGRVVVGARPPPGVPVHAATITVPSGFPSTRAAARSAARQRGVDGVADAVATGFVNGLFPPTRTRVAAGGSPPASAVIRHRYRRAERRFGVERSATLADGGVGTANDRLAAAVSDRIARDLRRTNASASDAADSVRLDRVHITVRTWP
ncbi:MAG: hypothetical protein ABEJ73_05625 [Haloplanus sp.]